MASRAKQCSYELHRRIRSITLATFPYNYVERNFNPNKITVTQENQLLVDFQDLTNNLIARCNAKFGVSIATVVLKKQSDSGTPLTSVDYDSNMGKLESAFNSIISVASSCGFNTLNTINLIKISDLDRPLYIQDRDTNCSTIQIFLNTANTLFTWAGF